MPVEVLVVLLSVAYQHFGCGGSRGVWVTVFFTT